MAKKLYAVWCLDINQWLKELSSNVDDGGIAMLVFTNEREARSRAAKHYSYDDYGKAKHDGWCEVREFRVSQVVEV